eukprot:7306448-Pyramimonas_sp.AAC.1
MWNPERDDALLRTDTCPHQVVDAKSPTAADTVHLERDRVEVGEGACCQVAIILVVVRVHRAMGVGADVGPHGRDP